MLIVYVGTLVVSFLFVVMLLDLGKEGCGTPCHDSDMSIYGAMVMHSDKRSRCYFIAPYAIPSQLPSRLAREHCVLTWQLQAPSRYVVLAMVNWHCLFFLSYK